MAKKTEQKDSMVLYFEWLDNLSMLNDADAMAVLRAVRDYVQLGKAPALNGAAAMAFMFIKQQVDRDLEKWAAVKEKRSAAGKVGAAAAHSKRRDAANDAIAKTDVANDAIVKTDVANPAVDEHEHEHVDEHVHVHVKEKKDEKPPSVSPSDFTSFGYLPPKGKARSACGKFFDRQKDLP